MLREVTFRVGGILTIALGLALGSGLYSAGVGWEFLDAWLACGIAVAFGVFFLYVAREEHRDRLAFLADAEREVDVPPRSGSR